MVKTEASKYCKAFMVERCKPTTKKPASVKVPSSEGLKSKRTLPEARKNRDGTNIDICISAASAYLLILESALFLKRIV